MFRSVLKLIRLVPTLKLPALWFLCISTTLLAACGGSEGGSVPDISVNNSAASPAIAAALPDVNQAVDLDNIDTTPVTEVPEVEMLTGVFIDSFVANLPYIAGNIQGVTNEFGEFNYQEGDTVRFSIGATEFPEVLAKKVVTVLDLYNTDDLLHEGVVNVSRLLQTIDADNDAENGIQIPTDVNEKLKNISIELVQNPFFTADLADAFASHEINISEITPAGAALTHLSNSLLQNELIDLESLGTGAEAVPRLSTGKLVDTDNDAIADLFDQDDDNDGVLDEYDPFPYDAADSQDSDANGIIDSLDVDADTDGMSDVVDLEPDNSDCSVSQDTTASVCNTELLQNISHIEVGESGIAYLSNLKVNTIFRFDLVNNTWLTPVVLDSCTKAGTNLNVIEYDSTSQRLYMGFSSGEISYLNKNSHQPAMIHTHTEAVGYLTTFGDSLLVSGTDRNSKPVTINHEGIVQESTYVTILAPVPGEHVYSEPQKALYYLDERGKLTTLTVSPVSSRLHGGFPLDFGHTFKGPLLVSPDETTLLTGNGHYYNLSTDYPLGKLDLEFSQAYWSEKDGLIAAVELDGQNYIQRLDERFNVIEQVSIDYQPLHIYQNSGVYYLLAYHAIGGHFVATYEPSQDSDNDLVPNSQDAFPIDPAAALDTDLDGAPDKWNFGYDEADSNSGLVLDHFPSDATCSVATEAGADSCDHESLMPTTKPDAIVTGNNGTVFLLYSAQSLIYRWDIKTKRYVDSLYVGTGTVAPHSMTYSHINDRLYLGYSNGAVTYISMNSTSRVETNFVMTAAPVESVSYAGAYIRVGSQLDHSSIVKYYNHDAKVISEPKNAEPSKFSVWDNTNNKLFILQADYLDNLTTEYLDNNGDLIRGWGDNPGWRDTSPIVVSPDGLTVMVGSGLYYDAGSLAHLGELDSSFITGAFWNGMFVAGSGNQSNTELTYYNESYQRSSSDIISGMPLAVFSYTSELVVITYATAVGISITTISAP